MQIEKSYHPTLRLHTAAYIYNNSAGSHCMHECDSPIIQGMVLWMALYSWEFTREHVHRFKFTVDTFLLIFSCDYQQNA